MDINSTVNLHSGNKMPIMGLGTWQLANDTAGTIADALTLGYRMIDTSGDYGTQPGIGEGIKSSGIKRDLIYLVTKVEETDDAYEATRKNLGELKLDYANLVLIHRPPVAGPGQELWEGLIKAKKEGLAKDIGVSNYPIDFIQELMNSTGEVPAVNQIEWSPFGYSEEMLRFCRDKQIIIQAYSPLTRIKLLNDSTLSDVASHYKKTPAQILIRWNLQMGTVPLPKANQPKHLEENINVFDFEINQVDMTTLNGLNEHFSSIGSLPYVEY
ncbi:MAG TPA: aldo/keto reductase [Chitinophagaceae bacterium]|jgi:2,5-diketo-D-gluconate reductase A|nr:aldo/keto reductase [Chitinophagaceae bacterium]